jgi:Flp pilus assembly pilin Flp
MSIELGSRGHAGRVVRALGRDARGSVTTEYVIVVGVVSLAVAGALLGVGPKLVTSYAHARDTLGRSSP